MASIVGSFLGTCLIFSIPDRVIYLVSAVTMIMLAIVSIARKSGIHAQSQISRAREYVYYLCLFCLTFVGNLFIAGSGVWYYFVNTFVIRLSSLEAKGQATAMSIFWFIGTFFAILVQGQYVLSWAIALGLGMFIGGYFGTKHIIKIGNHALRNILLGTIIVFALYFLYLSFHV